MSDYNVSRDGAIYAKAATVTNEATNQIADFAGAASLTIRTTNLDWRGQSYFIQEQALIDIGASMNFATVLFDPATLGTVYGITATSGSTLEAAPATATIWEFDTTSMVSVPNLEFLIQQTRSSDSKKVQLWMAAGNVAGDFAVPFTPREWMTHDMAIAGMLDANNDLLKVILES